MGENTKIEWANATFSPWWGCTQVSPACGMPIKGREDEPHGTCYALTWSERCGFSEKGSKFPIWGQDAARRFFSDKHWKEPERWNAKAEREGVRRRVFCGSMCDVMEDRGDLNEHRERLYALIQATPMLDWLLLTKRPQNFRRFLPAAWLFDPQPNVWIMTTVESADYLWRIDALNKVPSVVRGLSVEPLLSAMPTLGEHLEGIGWCIVGGESGPGSRPMHPDWARGIRDQCAAAGVAYHFKQWGHWGPDKPEKCRDWGVLTETVTLPERERCSTVSRVLMARSICTQPASIRRGGFSTAWSTTACQNAACQNGGSSCHNLR